MCRFENAVLVLLTPITCLLTLVRTLSLYSHTGILNLSSNLFGDTMVPIIE